MPLPPLEYLLDASLRALQDLELAALNREANTRKRLHHELEMAIEQAVESGIARWFIDHRGELLRSRSLEVKPHKVEFFDQGEKKSA